MEQEESRTRVCQASEVEHEDFKLMKKVLIPDVVKLSRGTWKQAFDLLKDTLRVTYGDCQFDLLVSAVEQNPLREAASVSLNFSKIGESNGWSDKTLKSVVSNMKRILNQTTISPNFINKLTTVKERGIDRNSNEYCLPSLYKKYDINHPTKKMLLKWIEVCKEETRNKSVSSLRQIIRFALKLCADMQIDLLKYDEQSVSEIPLSSFKATVEKMNIKTCLKTRTRFAAIVIKNFFRSKVILREDLAEWQQSLKSKKSGLDRFERVRFGERGKISSQELFAMFKTAKTDSARNFAIFLLLSTTDLRSGSISGLLLKHVSSQIENEVVVFDEGQVLQGRKCSTFVICNQLKSALYKYIIEERSVLSDYLFPGFKQESLSASRISKIIKQIAEKAGIDSPRIHARAIGHSFVNLLDTENDSGLVETIMGPYLKETPAEASKRCNIKWLSKEP